MGSLLFLRGRCSDSNRKNKFVREICSHTTTTRSATGEMSASSICIDSDPSRWSPLNVGEYWLKLLGLRVPCECAPGTWSARNTTGRLDMALIDVGQIWGNPLIQRWVLVKINSPMSRSLFIRWDLFAINSLLRGPCQVLVWETTTLSIKTETEIELSTC